MSDTIRGGTCFFCEAAWAGISRSLRLSKREIEILQRLMLGDDKRGASLLLGLPLRTFQRHLERIHQKLGVHTEEALIVRLFDAYFDWLCEASPPPGCRMNVRLARFRTSARMKRSEPRTVADAATQARYSRFVR
jgi:DNA-binding CsgD family transcriptional regulator